MSNKANYFSKELSEALGVTADKIVTGPNFVKCTVPQLNLDTIGNLYIIPCNDLIVKRSGTGLTVIINL